MDTTIEAKAGHPAWWQIVQRPVAAHRFGVVQIFVHGKPSGLDRADGKSPTRQRHADIFRDLNLPTRNLAAEMKTSWTPHRTNGGSWTGEKN